MDVQVHPGRARAEALYEQREVLAGQFGPEATAVLHRPDVIMPYIWTMPSDNGPEMPQGTDDERELLLRWLAFLRGAVLRKAEGVSDDEARWTPPGVLIPLLGIVNHLTRVEWRWIDGGMRGEETSRSEEEFRPGPELTITAAVAAYRERAKATEEAVREIPSLAEPCRIQEGTDLRWVLLHLINETARHAGHADAVRELLDGTTGQ